MTYSPGGPGYPPAQPGGSYPGATPSFAKAESGESKLPLYLNVTVVGLGFLVYLLNFGPVFTDLVGAGAGAAGHDGGIGVALAVLAALLAGLSLLPKAKSNPGLVAAIAVLGALLVIAKTLNAPGSYVFGWAVWPLLACSVLQAIAAVAAVLLEAGVITAPTPRPKYDPYAGYGQYGQYGQYGTPGYYSQPAQPPAAPHNPQQPGGYGSQYPGYQSSQNPTQAAMPSPSTGGFGAQSSPQSGAMPAAPQGPTTPPTGFPSFSPPPSVGAESGQQQSPQSPPAPA